MTVVAAVFHFPCTVYGDQTTPQLGDQSPSAGPASSGADSRPLSYEQLSDLDHSALSGLPQLLRNEWLLRAASEGDVDYLNRLLTAGADIEARSRHGQTPLLLAYSNGHEDVVILLLSHGADSAARADDGTTVDAIATARGRKSAGLRQRIIRVSAKSKCGEAVNARCPRGYELVGGGIDMDSVRSDGDTCRSWSNHINREFFMHSAMSKPDRNTSAWRCRADNRKVKCYAMCIQRNAAGIRRVKRKGRRIIGQNSGCGDNCPTSTYRSCPPGHTVLGGGIQVTTAWEYKNEACCKESDVEEFKEDFGYYVSGNGVQCHVNSGDHWGKCWALCVPNSQLANVDVVIKGLSSESKKARSACGSDQELIGCGFWVDDGGDDRITRLRCKPNAGSNKAQCRVRAVRKSREYVPRAIDDNKIKCQAACLKF